MRCVCQDSRSLWVFMLLAATSSYARNDLDIFTTVVFLQGKNILPKTAIKNKKLPKLAVDLRKEFRKPFVLLAANKAYIVADSQDEIPLPKSGCVVLGAKGRASSKGVRPLCVGGASKKYKEEAYGMDEVARGMDEVARGSTANLLSERDGQSAVVVTKKQQLKMCLIDIYTNKNIGVVEGYTYLCRNGGETVWDLCFLNNLQTVNIIFFGDSRLPGDEFTTNQLVLEDGKCLFYVKANMELEE